MCSQWTNHFSAQKLFGCYFAYTHPSTDALDNKIYVIDLFSITLLRVMGKKAVRQQLEVQGLDLPSI
jgi:hypothetical protein